MRNIFKLTALVLLVLNTFTSIARADLFVVVNVANPVTALSQKEVTDIFMGRSKTFPSKAYAKPLDLPRGDALRTEFYQALTGMGAAQLNSYWSRLLFSGQTTPPPMLGDEAAMLQTVRSDPSALGYLGTAPTDAQVRVVFTLKTSTK